MSGEVGEVKATARDVARWLENWHQEIDSAVQYRAMATGEKNEQIADVYRRLAAFEDKHADFWEARLRAAGRNPGPRRPSVRARVLAWIARRFGAGTILSTIAAGEYAQRNDYLAHPETRGTGMTEDERMHARVLARVLARTHGLEGGALARLEGRHRNVGGNALRAAVLGANDGLCSNLSLVMGVAGASADHRVVLLTGLAGLLAGALSMALGEWVSVTSARELAEREIRIERSEIEENPGEEREELQLIYESKGLARQEASDLATSLMKDENAALDALAREELGIDPDQLGGSPWTAALASLFLFAFGAIIPVVPFMVMAGPRVPLVSIAAGGVGLFAIGAAISLLTGRSMLWSGARQLLLGFAAAGTTYLIGRAIGVAVGG
ncbi:MAG TPA: VIT1/CCC1 transporter family protein [Kofleriaceae bacterium]|nr:VIT1/CCC1 transporter family protein [Kofleriaceae bacterium]